MSVLNSESEWRIYIYIYNMCYFIQRRHENMPPCTGGSVNANYERIASRVWDQPQTWDPWISETPIRHPPPTAVSSVLTIRPWLIRQKTDWHQSNGRTHCTQQSAYRGGKSYCCTLQWRHYELDGVSNHQPHDCYSRADQRKHQSSASLVFVWGIHRSPVNSPHEWPVTRKTFPFDDVIMAGLLTWNWCIETAMYRDMK